MKSTTGSKANRHNLYERDGIWYFQKTVNGKREFNGRRTPFSLDTSDLAVARAMRDKILYDRDSDKLDQLLGRGKTVDPATLGEIFEAYLLLPTVKANAEVRKLNIRNFTTFIRYVKGKDFNVEKASSAILTKQFVKDWQIMKLAEINQKLAGNVAAIEKRRRGMNSILRQVRSLFSERAVEDYTLTLPATIQEFMAASDVAAAPQDEPEQLPDALVFNLMTAVEDLRKINPACWAVFQLMMYGGLRNKECCNARENWLVETPAGYSVKIAAASGTFKTKNGKSRTVILPREIGLELLAGVASGPQPEPAADGIPVSRYLVPAETMTARKDAAYRDINIWLTKQGVPKDDSNKVAYRLRKLFLDKLAEQQGLKMAQFAAGHASEETTKKHYTGKPKMNEPIRLGGSAS